MSTFPSPKLPARIRSLSGLSFRRLTRANGGDLHPLFHQGSRRACTTRRQDSSGRRRIQLTLGLAFSKKKGGHHEKRNQPVVAPPNILPGGNSHRGLGDVANRSRR